MARMMDLNLDLQQDLSLTVVSGTVEGSIGDFTIGKIFLRKYVRIQRVYSTVSKTR